MPSSIFSRHAYIFSTKCYFAAMVALYLAFSMGLPKPFWAMTTAYIVAQPWAGAVRSKAIYRLVGTFLGSAVTVYLVPQFVSSPPMLTIIIMVWMGACLYLSVLDRTPRAYMFMLAGYTAAMIGFPSVSHPLGVFDTALARVQEISLGIICATIVHSVVLPKHFAPVFLFKVDVALRDSKNWLLDLLVSNHNVAKDRRILAADIAQLRVLATHVPYDTSHLRWTLGIVSALQNHLHSLFPLITSFEEKLQLLSDNEKGVPQDIQCLLKDFEGLLSTQSRSSTRWLRLFHTRTDLLVQAYAQHAGWYEALCLSTLYLFRDLLDEYRLSIRARNDLRLVQRNKRVPSTALSFGDEFKHKVYLHRDHLLALRSAIAVMVAIAICVVFWYYTAWPAGANAVMMAAIFSSFFAAQDDPTPSIRLFFKFTLYSLPVSALYLLVVMPAVNSFESLALSLFPTLLFLGLFIENTVTSGRAMAFVLGFSGSLAMHETMNPSIADFTNMMVAQLLGLLVAMTVALIFRSFTSAQRVRHIQNATHKDIVRLCRPDFKIEQAVAIRSIMLDRIGMLQSRLRIKTANEKNMLQALGELRLVHILLGLQELRARTAIKNDIDKVLSLLRDYIHKQNETQTAFLADQLKHITTYYVNLKSKDKSQQDLLVVLLGLHYQLNDFQKISHHAVKHSLLG